MTINKSLTTALLLGSTTIAAMPAFAVNDYNRISFNSEVKSEVQNDELTATMSKTAQAATPAAIANELNKSLNAAMTIARRYPEITVTTGQQSTYPRYDAKDSSKIVGFTGSVAINIKSSDFAKASQLIADLQSTLVMENISFGVSEKARVAEEKRLQQAAIKKFQDEALSISQAFGASSYKIVNVSLGGGSQYYARPVAMMTRGAEMDAMAVAAPSLEAGNSTISYSANGTIKINR